MKNLLIILLMLCSILGSAQSIYLTADSTEGTPIHDTYDLIRSKLLFSEEEDGNEFDHNTGDVINSPDELEECTGHSSSTEKHIQIVQDNIFNKKVFKFSIHSNLDNLGCQHNQDIQRNEIKVATESPEYLKGAKDETFNHMWSFKLNQNFQPSEKNTILHQLVSVSVSNEETSLIRIVAIQKSDNQLLEIQHLNDSGVVNVLDSIDLRYIKGNWIQVSQVIKYSDVGRYQIIISNQLSQNILLSYNSEELKTWKNTTKYISATWGINRQTNVAETLQDEDVLYSFFLISQYDQDEEEEDEVSDELPNPDLGEVCTDQIEYRKLEHKDFYMYYNPYRDELSSANHQGLNAWKRFDTYQCTPDYVTTGGDNTAGKYITYEQISIWNKNNPCKQISPPDYVVKSGLDDNGNYINPYGRKKNFWNWGKSEQCGMSYESIKVWNEKYRHLQIDVPIEYIEQPNEPIGPDDDLSYEEEVNLPQIEGDENEDDTVFVLTTQDEDINDFSFLDGQILDAGLDREVKGNFEVDEFENGERDERGYLKRSDKKKKWYDLKGIAEMTESILKIPGEIIKSGFVGYYDPAGSFIRINEKEQTERYRKNSLETTKSMGAVGVATELENFDRKSFDMDAGTLPFFEYENSCNSYLSLVKRKECNDKVQYLKDAFRTVNEVIYAYDRRSPYNSYFKPNRGIAEQIREKYVAIQNKIYQELEGLKNKANKEGWLKAFNDK